MICSSCISVHEWVIESECLGVGHLLGGAISVYLSKQQVDFM